MKRTIIALLLICLNQFLLAAQPLKNKEAPPSDPTIVKVAAYVIDLISIQGAEQSFTADITSLLEWNDPRLAHTDVSARILPLDDIWQPNIIVTNLREAKRSLPETVEIQPDGTVSYRQRTMGTFTSHLDLRKFPNDKQVLFIQIVSRGHYANQVQLVPHERWIGRSKHLTISDWSVGDVELATNTYPLPGENIELAGLRMEMPVQRLVGYYIGTVLASATIILGMAWLVFWIPIDAINPRISVSVTSMLTLIAHRFVIQGELPNLPYLTRMDYFLLGSTLMILLGLTEVIAVFRLFNKGQETRARKLNSFFRWSYPVPFILLLLTVLPI